MAPRLRDRLTAGVDKVRRALDPWERAATTRITRDLTASEQTEFQHWVDSKSTSNSPRDEMIIAFRIAKLVGRGKTSVIRSLRNQRGQDPQVIRRLEDVVKRNPTICFVEDGRVRRVAFSSVGKHFEPRSGQEL